MLGAIRRGGAKRQGRNTNWYRTHSLLSLAKLHCKLACDNSKQCLRLDSFSTDDARNSYLATQQRSSRVTRFDNHPRTHVYVVYHAWRGRKQTARVSFFTRTYHAHFVQTLPCRVRLCCVYVCSAILIMCVSPPPSSPEINRLRDVSFAPQAG